VTRAVPASEVLLFHHLVRPVEGSKIFPVLISRSGHTSEVLQVAEHLNKMGVEFLAVTCDGRELAGMTPRVLKLPVVEESTVMTASFTSMVLGQQYLAAKMAKDEKFISALKTLPDAVEALLKIYGPKVEAFAATCFEGVVFEDVAILGQGPLYAIASEAALKVMESSSSYAQYFHTLEFRHGPKSIVQGKAIVGALLSEEGYKQEAAVLKEMKGLGARTISIANEITDDVAKASDLAISLNLAAPSLARLIAYIVWGQLLGSYLGLRKGLDPDEPTNLSRVVTISE
jgi:glucosamine--fructose-6-phosphate aminotransferase (isomerizing)